MRVYIRVIEKYADIADVFHDKNVCQIGIYDDLVRGNMKVRPFGGMVMLGTKRPDSTVIYGQLKINALL